LVNYWDKYHTYRCDDTRGCLMQFWPPDDEHMCSKHVEAWRRGRHFGAETWSNGCLIWRILCYVSLYFLQCILLEKIWNSEYHMSWNYRVIKNYCRGFNNLSYTIHLRYSICVFYLTEQHSKFLLHILQVLYMCTLCDSTNINTIIDNYRWRATHSLERTEL